MKVEAKNIILDMSYDEEDSNLPVNSDKKLSVKRKRDDKEGICQKEEINDERNLKIHDPDKKLSVKRKRDDKEGICQKEEINDERNLKIHDPDKEDYTDEDSNLSDFHLGISDSEDFMFNELDTGECKRKKALGPLKLHFKCEWGHCPYETDDVSKFHIHVSYHIPDLHVKTLANGEEVYLCQWAQCSYFTEGTKAIQRHVNFHSYHRKLKNIGEEVLKQRNMSSKCKLDDEMRNFPADIEPLICEWFGCYKDFFNIQVFFHHIQTHVNETINENKITTKAKCHWQGCKSSTVSMTRAVLTKHVRIHSQEKVVACPVCGRLFANNTKLIDHCERQITSDLAQYQCSQCYKHYSTMRLLKDHVRGHVNFYKCCYCDMTASKKHTLSAHIRYKHLDSKPFKCNVCNYACKTEQDLKLHLTSHDPNPQFRCQEAGCEFACRTKRTIQRHMIYEHGEGSPSVYACHLSDCNKKFKRGCYLTKHLMNKHCLRWPSGHSKFIFTRDEDGIHRLQTVRYESMKLFKESKSPALTPKSNFKVTAQPGEGSRSFAVSSVDLESESATSQVLISIEDESGNTINSCTTTEVVGDVIPKNATVLAAAEPGN